MGLFDIPKMNKKDIEGWGDKYKFTKSDNENNEFFFEYGKIYQAENKSIKIGASQNAIDLILKLADNLNPPFYILYVLVVSRLGNEHGRYQSPIIETREELQDFLFDFREYFETDGRHHIWIGTTDNSGLLVYDQHNVIFAYGPIEKYLKTLEKDGFKEQSFSFPFPHGHSFHADNDKYEDSILSYYEWSWFQLKDSDEY